MMPTRGHRPSILRMATHVKSSHGNMSGLARAVLFNLALARVLERLRRPEVRVEPTPNTPHHALMHGLGRAMLAEGVEMAMGNVRWQRRRVAAAIERAEVAASISARPVRAGAGPPSIPKQRSGDRKPAPTTRRTPIHR